MATNNQPHTQQTMCDTERPAARDSGPVTCLGLTFPNDEERRKHFLGILREKLKDPEFRKIEGFPIGSDEDILALSDPPYYTACPNPFIADFIKQGTWRKKTESIRAWLATRCVGQAFQPAIRYPELRNFTKHDLDAVRQYQRRLPHWELQGSTYFITFRVRTSVGQPFQAAAEQGTALAGRVEEGLWFHFNERYVLDAYVIMPDHVHLLLKPLPGCSLAKIMQGIKGYTARTLNQVLGRKGPFWQDENFDHLIRNEADWLDKFEYIHHNPVKAGLVVRAEDYPCSSLVTLHAEGRLESLPHTQKDNYNRKPFAADVSEGKTDPIYKAHSYHTKVPHLAIVPSILHYTEPGDVVLDGFCGTGMTGVAAQWCGTAPEEYRLEVESRCVKQGRPKPVWGARRVVLNDLSPAATFIAANYNLPFDVREFARAGRQILDEIEREIGWMYRTVHASTKDTKGHQGEILEVLLGETSCPSWMRIGRIEYTVWSEVFTCPDCAGEVVFLDEALDQETKRVKDTFPCPHCGSELTKQRLDRSYEARFDPILKKAVQTPKRKPSLIVYSLHGKRYEKAPDDYDLALLERIAVLEWPSEMPSLEIPPMHMTHERARMDRQGITHIHHFFLPRAAHALATLWRKANAHPDPRIRHMLLFFVEQAIPGMSVLNRYLPTAFSQTNRQLTGVYYVASQVSEVSPRYNLDGKLSRLVKAFRSDDAQRGYSIIAAGTTTKLQLQDACIDYIFTDPPFGENIYYADLNFLVESWHRVITNAVPEAIVDKFKKKGLPEYQHLMQGCFEEYCRVLKPGRWMTVVFHNSRNAVWNAIQEGMQAAGFVVADVRTLDKQQGSYRQVTSTAVKQDLVISAYKPNGGFEERFKLEAGTEDGVWDFVRTHLKQLPVFVSKDGQAEIIAERQNYLLFDRMVAFHVQRGVTVPLSAAEFYAGVVQRFSERDGMYFLPEQVTEYDKKRMTVREVLQLQLFVTDESSAIQWLKQQLIKKPQTFQELHPQFLKEIGGWQKHEKPLEISQLLDDTFICYDGKGEVPSQIHSYLSTNFKELRNLPKDAPELRTKGKDRWYVPDPNKAGDMEKKREKALLKEFEEYRTSSQKRLKVFRLEAVRAGFKKAWQERDYATIITVARKIPENVLQEDPKLLMWYDQALTRKGDAQ